MWSNKLLAGAFSLIPSVGICQSLGYVDADNQGEAVGMMQTTLITAQVMKEECGKRFPELIAELEANLSAWQKKESAVIRTSNSHWAEMKKADPNAAKQVPIVEASIRKGLAAVSEMPGENGARVFTQVCRQHFSALASGIWRTRTPNVYKFLDSAR
jgi:hypothetical protein